jgi:hypothetical protein
MSLKDIDGAAITTKYIIRFINIFVASVTKRIFVTKKDLLKISRAKREGDIK